MRGRIPRPSPALVVACIALAIALSGAGYAAIVIPANSVGSVQIKPNAVNSSKVANGTLLKADFRARPDSRRPEGPGRPRRPRRPRRLGRRRRPGRPGRRSGDRAVGVGRQNGTLVRNKGAASAQKQRDGQYQVVFNQDVTGLQLPGDTSADRPPGQHSGRATASQLPASTRASSTDLQQPRNCEPDSSFFLAVFC